LESYLDCDRSFFTYGNRVSNINQLLDSHLNHGKIATLSALRPHYRFGMIDINGDTVEVFEEKPQLKEGYINGGFFVFEKGILNYLNMDENCDFEFGPLQQVAIDGQLKAFKHDNFWQFMDIVRERGYLDSMWHANKAKYAP